DGGIGLEHVHRPRLQHLPEGEARLLALSRRDGDVGGPAHLGLPGEIVRRHGLFEPREVVIRDLAGEALGFAHAPGPVGVHHDADAGPEGLAHLRHAGRRIVHAGVLAADAQLHRAVAALDVLEHLLADAPDLRPAAGGIGGDAIAVAAAQQLPYRHPERAAEDVPERDIHAGDGRQRDAAAADGGEGPAFAHGVVGPAAVVEKLPGAGDVQGIAADQQRGELLPDQRHDGAVVSQVADRRLGLAQSRDARIRLDLDEAHVEGIVAAEVADMDRGGRDGSAEPGGTDGGDSHGGSGPTRLAGGPGQVKAPGDYASRRDVVTSAITPTTVIRAPTAEAATTMGRAAPRSASASASPPRVRTAAPTTPSAATASQWRACDRSTA